MSQINKKLDDRRKAVEGINQKIKLIKRRAYGLSNFDNFRRRVLLNWHFLFVNYHTQSRRANYYNTLRLAIKKLFCKLMVLWF